VHDYVHEILTYDYGGKERRSELVVTPPMQLINAYARKVARSPGGIVAGFLAIEIFEGVVGRMLKLTKSLDVRQREVL
jgi:hypothetical protein